MSSVNIENVPKAPLLIGAFVMVALVAFFLGGIYKTSSLQHNLQELAAKTSEFKTEQASVEQEKITLKAAIAARDANIATCEQEKSTLAQTITSEERLRTQCEDAIQAADARYETCAESTATVQEQHDTAIATCESRITEVEQHNVEMKAELNTCQDHVDDTLDIIKTAVRAVCCSFSDIQESRTRQWDKTGNQIICSQDGEFTMECGSGATDYYSG
ncbi:MAG: hypothetical protein OXR66_01070 [Candidatus Woesearchaeota archaeon]|nr:hypothetical protein [Candidatus Woesearchaeota archaeon]